MFDKASQTYLSGFDDVASVDTLLYKRHSFLFSLAAFECIEHAALVQIVGAVSGFNGGSARNLVLAFVVLLHCSCWRSEYPIRVSCTVMTVAVLRPRSRSGYRNV
jgi:hypothetical protein